MRAALLVAVALALLASARALALALASRVGLVVLLGGWLRLLVFALLAATALSVAALASELRRRPPRTRPLAALGWLWIALVLGWLAFLAWVQPFQRLWLDLALGLVAGAWAALVLLAPDAPGPAARRLGLGAFVACTALVGGELALRVVARLRPSPVLARVGEAPLRLIERFRAAPGEVRFGFAFNDRGYYDEPFVRRRAGERRVAVIGDSFNVGSVPHAWHYTTVAEERLGCRVDNLGVAGVGPPEYVRMLVDDALPLDPDVVVLALFVGNDLTYDRVDAEQPDPLLRAWLSRERVLLWVVPRRLARLAAERGRAAGPAAEVVGQRAFERPVDEATLRAELPWLDDPAREVATLSEAVFAELETRRAREVCRGVPRSLLAAQERVLQARRSAGRAALAVLLIPDEFQVEDALWAAVEARAGVPLERDLPQRLLAAWLEREGIPFLDLLPRLRAEPPLADGARHLYHLRDTHFNARGNRVAGEALAELVAPLLER